METSDKLYATSRDDWRAWLRKNYDTKKEVWLIYYKKQTGKPSVPYDDSVEEALCFGWIDSAIKKIDDEKFTARAPVKKELVVPSYVKEALANNKKALENFNNLAKSYKRQYIGWIASAKREETRMRRLAEAIRLLEKNEKLGMK